MSESMEALRARVVAAERVARVSAVVCLGAIVFGAVLGLRGEGPEWIEGVGFEDGVITVRGLVVVDGEGTPRIEMGDDGEAQRRVGMYGIVIRDVEGAERFGVGVNEEDWVVLGMDAAPGVGSPMRDRLALIVGADGSAAVQLIDNQTTVPVGLFTEGGGGGGVMLSAYDEEAGTLSTRSITFEGEGASTVRGVGGG